MEQFQLNFEQVLLHDAFGPPGPVYLFMRATVYDPLQPEIAIWTGSTGGLSPNDANVPSDGEIISVEPFAASLPAGALVRSDGAHTGRQNPNGPNFAVLPIPLAPNERIRLEVLFAPEVWFRTTHLTQSAWDRALITIFLAAVGGAGGGVGAIVGALVGILDPFGGSDADVPCFNPILMESHDWDAKQFRALAGEEMHEYGPTGAPGGLGCPQARASYWLSAQILGFAETHQVGCVVLPVPIEIVPYSFAGRWGDFGLTSSDQVNAWITPSIGATDAYDIIARERQTASRELRAAFASVRVTEEMAAPWFLRNEYASSPLGYREAKPLSDACATFTNLKQGTPWADRLIRFSNMQRLIDGERALDTEAVHEMHAQPSRSLQSQVDVQHVARNNDTVSIGSRGVLRSGTAPSLDLLRPFTIYGTDDSRSFRLVRVLRLSPELVLMEYGEFHRSKMLQRRLRYLRTDGSGQVLTDVLLRPTNDPPR